MHTQPPARADLRLAELIAALSLATDLGTGLPLGQALRTCLLATRFAEVIGLGERECREVYYVALLRSVGCVATARELAPSFYDELAFTGQMYARDAARPGEVLPVLLRHAGAGMPVLERAWTVARVAAEGPRGRDRTLAADCEVASLLAARLGMPDAVAAGVGQVYERWDGKGSPNHLKGEAIARSARIVAIASTADLYHRVGGLEAVRAILRRRGGGMCDPALAARFSAEAPRLERLLEDDITWEAALAAEPGPQQCAAPADLDRAMRAIADFADLKSKYTVGHSPGVAALAEAAARALKLPEPDCVVLRRAAYLHDVGRVGVPVGIWNKPARLTEGEWERVRLHPYYTERAFARAGALAHITALATCHHERLDGSGYYRSLPAGMLSLPARVLAAADAYHAMTELRPHRPALTAEAAAAALLHDARAGRLDGDAARAVLVAAGHAVKPVRRELPAGLSEREVEVLRLIARGLPNRDMARTLGIAEKTVGHHIQHIYNKIGLSTRAAATLFAVQHGLIPDTALPAQ